MSGGDDISTSSKSYHQVYRGLSPTSSSRLEVRAHLLHVRRFDVVYSLSHILKVFSGLTCLLLGIPFPSRTEDCTFSVVLLR